MKKALTVVKNTVYHYVDGVRVNWIHSGLTGDCSELSGNCSGLRGDCSRLSGDCTGLSGDCSRLSGDCSELRGDLDQCEITVEERIAGIDIDTLVNI